MAAAKPLAYSLGTEQAPVAGNPVHSDFFLVEEDIISYFKNTDRSIQMGSHEVGQIEFVIG